MLRKIPPRIVFGNSLPPLRSTTHGRTMMLPRRTAPLTIWRGHLSRAQTLAIAAHAADPRDLPMVLPEVVLPPASFADHRDEARGWCARAPLAARVAYCRAAVAALPLARRHRFHAWAIRHLAPNRDGAPPAVASPAVEHYSTAAAS